jgi:hypothetical protein
MKLAALIVLSLVHVTQGCHTWQLSSGKNLPATTTVAVKVGGHVRVEIRCPMDFVVSGPLVGGQLWHGGTAHVLSFPKRGVYTFTAVNVQTPEEVGLQTLGATNVPKLIVRVR